MTAMAIVPTKELEHLVFSGGGARAVVHLGAIAALEKELGATSLAEAQFQGKSSLAGFAGASAGALVAAAIACGYSAKDLRGFLNKWLVARKTESDLEIPRIVRADAYGGGSGTVRTDKPYLISRETVFKEVKSSLKKDFEKDLLIKETLAYYGLGNEIDLINEIAEDSADLIGKLPHPIAQGTSEGLEEIADATSTATWAKAVRRILANAAAKAYKVRLQRNPKVLDRARQRAKNSKLKGQTIPAPPDLRWITEGPQFPLLMFNLLAEGGLLPGIGLRNMIFDLFESSPLRKWRGVKSPALTKITFEEFRNVTEEWIRAQSSGVSKKATRSTKGFDVVMTGANLSTREIGYFSAQSTPDFPVAAALQISMRYPLLFKPLTIAQGAPAPARYVGQWVDGGLLNNFPLNAFARGDYDILGHKVLGFYIEEDRDYSSAVTVDQMAVLQARELIGTLLSQSTGQAMRGLLEELQSVELSADGLSTLDLSPDRKLIDLHVESAKAKTLRHLRKSGCDPRIKAEKTIPHRSFEAICRRELRSVFEYVSNSSMHVHIGIPGASLDAADFDIVVYAGSNQPRLVYDAKGSPTAELTGPQRRVRNLLMKQDGFINPSRDEGPLSLSQNSVIATQLVRILRPETLCEEIGLVREWIDKNRLLTTLPLQMEELD